MKPSPITQIEFKDDDHKKAEAMAQKLGYEQCAYTSSSDLWGLYCFPENTADTKNLGCIIKTNEFGLMFIQLEEDI